MGFFCVIGWVTVFEELWDLVGFVCGKGFVFGREFLVWLKVKVGLVVLGRPKGDKKVLLGFLI